MGQWSVDLIKRLQKYIQNGRFESFVDFLKNVITELNELVFSTEVLYFQNFAKKLQNKLLQEKNYWSILKIFYSGKKVSLIPPYFVDIFVSDMKTKIKHFQRVFWRAMYTFEKQQCTSH